MSIPTSIADIIEYLEWDDNTDNQKEAAKILKWLTALRAKIPPPPPPGAVPVRVAVAMTENGEYVAMGSSRYFIETAMKGAVGINKGKPAAIITAHIMPPRMAEVTGTVEQPQGDSP